MEAYYSKNNFIFAYSYVGRFGLLSIKPTYEEDCCKIREYKGGNALLLEKL